MTQNDNLDNSQELRPNLTSIYMGGLEVVEHRALLTDEQNFVSTLTKWHNTEIYNMVPPLPRSTEIQTWLRPTGLCHVTNW